ncbi:hypothetical protein CBR_g50602 [Chara braunii]|uniref:FAS1 domain-containing protein n=1 Tax=Chara braunii TaxID=69332 RepID=A0A388M6Z1_CHABU|nr:hypothetical protein CBR_g50602 [Chara braunii]|eukprot:GBG90354.1 hypothetical protein CBR_g50602 [Chara braunii]
MLFKRWRVSVKKPEGVTIFAPTDESLLAAPESVTQCLRQSPRSNEIASAFLLSHAIPGSLPIDAQTTKVSQSPNGKFTGKFTGKFMQPTLAGGDSSAVVIRQAASRYPGANTGIFVDDAQILPDGSNVVTASGLVVHAIDGPILTPHVVQMLSEACPGAVPSAPPPLTPVDGSRSARTWGGGVTASLRYSDGATRREEERH